MVCRGNGHCLACLEGAVFNFNKRKKKGNGLDIIKAVGGVLNIFLNKRAVKIFKKRAPGEIRKRLHRTGSV